jgi:hypothetical protein
MLKQKSEIQATAFLFFEVLFKRNLKRLPFPPANNVLQHRPSNPFGSGFTSSVELRYVVG